MEHIHQFPDRETIEHEAAEWLMLLDGDTPPTPEQLAALSEWLQRSPAHRNELHRLAEFWSDQSLAVLPIALEDLEYQPAPWAIRKLRSIKVFWQQRQRMPLLPAMALILVVALTVTLAIGPQWRYFGDQQALYATAIGQQQSHTLADGSVIYLNTNSQVRVDYSKEQRTIYLLQGEAYFGVTKQPGRPFRVYAGRGRVEAVGTAFTVYLRDGDIDVAVSEGVVALGALANKADADIVSVSTHSDHSLDGLPVDDRYSLSIPVDELGLLEAGEITTILVAEEAACGE